MRATKISKRREKELVATFKERGHQVTEVDRRLREDRQ